MLLAWHYERSPDGFIRTNSKQSWRNPYKPGQRKPLTGNFIIIALILLIIFMYTYPRFGLPPVTESETVRAVSSTKRSIAVIPFVDLSPRGDQEWFSDGMMDEILNHLVQIQDLMVTSRTSAMRYKASEKSLQEIGQELGVSYILEGSVRKQENRVRITVQLIDVETDRHLWSDTYDRTLNDVFGIQSEVVQQVASSLQVQVHPEVKLRIEAPPTSNSNAYDLYLEGLYLYNKLNYEDWDNAEELLEKVIEIDPGFAEAYALIGQIKSSFTWADDGNRVSSPEEAVRIAMPYFKKALEYDPDNLLAHEFLGFLYLWYQWDFDKAEKEYQLVKRLNPQYNWTDFLITSGQFEKAVEETEREIQLDPFNDNVWGGRILSLYFSGDRKKTLATMEMILRNNIDHNPVERGRVYLYLEMYEEVISLFEYVRNNYDFGNVPRVTGTLAIAYYHLGEIEKSEYLLNEIKKLSRNSSGGSPSFYIAMIHAQMEEPNLAFDWLQKAYQDHEVEMYWLKVEPPFEPLHEDPRWQEMLDKVGLLKG
jgi:TolB-like protein/lipoprotein NlpI